MQKPIVIKAKFRLTIQPDAPHFQEAAPSEKRKIFREELAYLFEQLEDDLYRRFYEKCQRRGIDVISGVINE